MATFSYKCVKIEDGKECGVIYKVQNDQRARKDNIVLRGLCKEHAKQEEDEFSSIGCNKNAT